MRLFLLVLFLAFAGSAQAQLFGGDDGDGWRHGRVRCHCCNCRRREGWRDEERGEAWRRHRAREYAERVRINEENEDRRGLWHREKYRSWRHHEREEGYAGWQARERGDGNHGWRHPDKYEVYNGWWHPEGGWREPELRDGPRRCRPPMHAAGDARPTKDEAHSLAVKSWQEQVINEHGERFLNYDAAFHIDEHCDPARVGETKSDFVDLKRCVVTAAPCLTPREGDRSRGERGEEERRREDEHH